MQYCVSQGDTPGAAMNSDDVILISVDDHIAEPANMFEQHVPAKYKEYAPRVETDDRGIQQWWYGDIRGRNLGLNAVAGKPPEMYNVDASRYDEMRRGCYDVHERVRDMNAGGQLAGLNFPNWTGFSGQVLNQGPDLKINEIMIMSTSGVAPTPIASFPAASCRSSTSIGRPPRCDASPRKAATPSPSPSSPRR
jgi:hypothetical protein